LAHLPRPPVIKGDAIYPIQQAVWNAIIVFFAAAAAQAQAEASKCNAATEVFRLLGYDCPVFMPTK
jgi:hypothetical protein